MKTKKLKFSFGVIFTLAVISMHAISCSEKSEQQDQTSSPATKESKRPETDIFAAAFMGNLTSLRQHIDFGTDLNQKDSYGSTPLMIAATFGRTDVAKMLVEAGADTDIRNNDGSTALHSAAFLCRTEIVKILLEGGADKNIRNNFGSTALESVSGPFGDVKPIYDQFSKDLGVLGLKLDYAQLEKTRPVIAGMLQ